MADFNQGRSVISIKRTVEKHGDLCNTLIPLHAMTGCDTVPQMFGIGKNKGISVSTKHPLTLMGHIDSEEEAMVIEGKHFAAGCYGESDVNSSNNRLV